MTKAVPQDREQELTDAGAVREKREDRHGETRSGWWLDDVYLGRDSRTALESIRG